MKIDHRKNLNRTFTIKGKEKIRVVAYLYDQIDRSNLTIDIATKEIMMELELSRSTVIRSLNALMNSGLLVKTKTQYLYEVQEIEVFNHFVKTALQKKWIEDQKLIKKLEAKGYLDEMFENDDSKVSEQEFKTRNILTDFS